jgi:small subunit ribosomal protein S4
MKLFLKGERCLSPKCAMEKRAYAPGMHGRSMQFRRKESDYAMQLREKQRAKRIYGVMEQQFRRYYDMALTRRGLTGANLLTILETRLDNIVYRLGFAESRAQARQLVLHKHFQVNGATCNVPSAVLEAGDTLTVHETSKQNGYFRGIAEVLEHQTVPEWLSLNLGQMSAALVAVPTREQIDVPLNEQLIVEFYSR